nr:MAG TPA: hypothetical protein [Caudoviricetes sp.]
MRTKNIDYRKFSDSLYLRLQSPRGETKKIRGRQASPYF